MFTRWHHKIWVACLWMMIIFSAVAVFAGKPIPNGKDAYTMEKYNLEVQAYVVGRMDLYEKHTKDPQKVRKSVKAFSQDALKRAQDDQSAPTWEQLEKKADELLAAKESDPLVLTDIGYVKLKLGNDDAIAIFKKAIKNFSASKYPALSKFHALKMLRWIFNNKKMAREWDPYRQDFVRQMVAVMADPLKDPKTRRMTWNEIGEYLEVKGDSPGAFSLQTQIYDAVQKTEKIDPWIQTMVNGWHHCGLGWKMRGNGFANTVTEEGAKGFMENMAKSAEYFTKAWEMDPTLPDAATAMIHISMAGGDEKHTPRDWFDRAVEAQMDSKPAYDALVWSLRPRWSGSHTEMYKFGLECLATKRFDTAVPDRFIRIVLDIDSELDENGEIWREEGVFENLKILKEGVENEPCRIAHSNPNLMTLEVTLSTYFLIAVEVGKYDEARKVLDRLGDTLSCEAFSRFNRRYPYDVSRIYALTGSAREEMRIFDGMALDNGYRDPEALKKALATIEKAAAADANPQAKYYYDYWKTCLRGLQQFDKGQWVELSFDKTLSAWQPMRGQWNAVNDRTVSSTGIPQMPDQGLECTIPFGVPYEIQCDVQFDSPAPNSQAGLMVNNLWKVYKPQAVGLFGVNTLEKNIIYANINVEPWEENIHVADTAKCHLLLRFWNPQFEFYADGQPHSQTALFKASPREVFCLSSSLLSEKRFSNIRIRKLSYGPPPEEEKYAERLAYFEEALRRDPKDAHAYQECGAARQGLGKFDEAVADCKKSLDILPYWTKPYATIAAIEAQRGHFAPAFEILESYAKISPDNPDILAMKALLQATAAEEKYRNGQAALDNAKKACEATRFKQYALLEVLAAANAETGNFDEALKWATEALKLAPQPKKKKCQAELELYQSRKPLRATAMEAAAP
jgi:tetratricopeptide (TPR) repeat protein